MKHSKEEIEALFPGEILVSLSDLAKRLSTAKAIVFDWDGVFNNGQNFGKGSVFSEVDSMATNMLRFLLWLQNKDLPYTAIVTGSKNFTAIDFAEREHFNNVYLNAKNKAQILDEILLTQKIKESEIIFFFDDILDMPIVERAGIKIMVGGSGRPLWNKYIKDNKLADYISCNSGIDYGLREGIELLLALSGRFAEIVEKRSLFTGNYENYLNSRNNVETMQKIL